ncbi:MAG: hypothetical protein K2X81_19160, partial [Candidatus Obscuribacterales bacterium]|nr:hypothetical protein [Candidatus Obscuribacterales bacterium]
GFLMEGKADVAYKIAKMNLKGLEARNLSSEEILGNAGYSTDIKTLSIAARRLGKSEEAAKYSRRYQDFITSGFVPSASSENTSQR